MDTSALNKLFPAFLAIEDPELRRLSMDAMAMAMEKGGWTMENIGQCPVTLNWKD